MIMGFKHYYHYQTRIRKAVRDFAPVNFTQKEFEAVYQEALRAYLDYCLDWGLNPSCTDPYEPVSRILQSYFGRREETKLQAVQRYLLS